MLETLVQDVRYGLRALRKNCGTPSGSREAAASAMVPCPFTHHAVTQPARPNDASNANRIILRMEEKPFAASLKLGTAFPDYLATLQGPRAPGKNFPLVAPVP